MSLALNVEVIRMKATTSRFALLFFLTALIAAKPLVLAASITQPSCDIVASNSRSVTKLVGVSNLSAPDTVLYRFVVKHQQSGQSTVSQSGIFKTSPDKPVTVGVISVGGVSQDQIEAYLELRSTDGVFLCDAKLGSTESVTDQ